MTELVLREKNRRLSLLIRFNAGCGLLADR
jgi:hypothetical protein